MNEFHKPLAYEHRCNDKPSTVTLTHAPWVNNSKNEQISQNPRRVAHLVMVCRAAKANLLAIETARRQQSSDHKHKVCQVGVTVNTE